MNTNNFWGKLRSTGNNVGLIVRVGLAMLSIIGSLALAWTLLNPHQRAHASPNTVTPTVTSTLSPTTSPTSIVSPTTTVTSIPSPTPTSTPYLLALYIRHGTLLKEK